MEPYIELAFETSEHDEIIQAALGDFALQGIVEDENGGWKAYFTHAYWKEREMEIRITVEKTAPGTVFLPHIVEQRNWNEEWEKSIEPVRVTPRFVIAPSWSDYKPAKGETVLIIDPKMSFGTGFHESTRLMIRLMERWTRDGDRVLDTGTGTGILAIAAVKMGASFAIGVDIDEWAGENASENIARNGVEDKIEIYTGSVDRAHGTFDLILSNITRNDNIALLDDYVKLLNPGGRVLLSGFYTHDEPDLTAACAERGLERADTETEHEWIAAAYQQTP